MRFGLPGGRGALDTDGPSSNREAILTAQRLGFDCVWFTDEPALADDATTWRTRGSALTLATAAAVATDRIRLGVAVSAGQLRCPLRVAADLATLDVLSHGRVTLVVGSGAQRTDLAAALDTVFECWAGRAVTIDGQRHAVEPAPAQRPRPPVFVAASDDASIMWAALQGHGLILAAARPAVAVRRGLELFAAHGGDVTTARVERFCLVGESDAQAQREGGPYVAHLAAYLRATTPLAQRAGLPEEAFSTERLMGETIVTGGPDTVAARIAQLREETGVQCVNVRPSLRGHCPFELQRVTVELFATEVVPRLGGARAPVAGS